MKRKTAMRLILLVFIGILGFSGWKLASALLEYRAGDETYKELEQFIQLPPQTDPPAISDQSAPEPTGETLPEELVHTTYVRFPEVDFETLWETSPDAVGWIYVEGTDINYPVVQGQDNDYYLDRMPNKRKNGAGSIFLDYRNDGDLSDRHSVLYGHLMQNGSMFGGLPAFRDQEYFDRHRIMLLMTPEGNYTVEFFAVYVANVLEDAWQLNFTDEADFTQWYQGVMQRSEVRAGTVVTPQDRILTLSTCNYDFRDARLLLVGVIRDA